MVYRTLGKNDTGQVLVGCPCVPLGFMVDMVEMPSGAVLFQVLGAYQRLYFLPSHRTIAVWCANCYEKLDEPPARVLAKTIANGREIEA